MVYRRRRSRSVVLGSRPLDEDERDLAQQRSPGNHPANTSTSEIAQLESFSAFPGASLSFAPDNTSATSPNNSSLPRNGGGGGGNSPPYSNTIHNQHEALTRFRPVSPLGGGGGGDGSGSGIVGLGAGIRRGSVHSLRGGGGVAGSDDIDGGISLVGGGSEHTGSRRGFNGEESVGGASSVASPLMLSGAVSPHRARTPTSKSNNNRRGGGAGPNTSLSPNNNNNIINRYAITRPIFVQEELTIEVDYYTRYPLHFFVFHGDRLSENLLECIHDRVAQVTFNVSALAKEVLGPLPNVDYVQLSTLVKPQTRFGTSNNNPTTTTTIKSSSPSSSSIAGRPLDVDPETLRTLGVQGRPCEGSYILIYSSLPDLPDPRARVLGGVDASTLPTNNFSPSGGDGDGANINNNNNAVGGGGDGGIMSALRDHRDGDRKETALLLAVREILVEDRRWKMLDASKSTLPQRDVQLLERTLCNGQLHKQLQQHGVGNSSSSAAGGGGSSNGGGSKIDGSASLRGIHNKNNKMVDDDDNSHFLSSGRLDASDHNISASTLLSPRRRAKLDHLLGNHHSPSGGGGGIVSGGVAGIGAMFEEDAVVEQTRMVFKKIVTVERQEDITDSVVKEEEERIYYIQQGQALYQNAMQHAQFSALCCEFQAKLEEQVRIRPRRVQSRGGAGSSGTGRKLLRPAAMAALATVTSPSSDGAGDLPVLPAGGRRRGSSIMGGGSSQNAIKMSVPGAAEEDDMYDAMYGYDDLEDNSPEAILEEAQQIAKSKIARLAKWFAAVETSQIPVGFVDYSGRTLLHWLVDWSECYSLNTNTNTTSNNNNTTTSQQQQSPQGSKPTNTQSSSSSSNATKQLRSMMIFCMDSGITPLLCGVDRRSVIDLACQPGREVAMSVLCEVVSGQHSILFPLLTKQTTDATSTSSTSKNDAAAVHRAIRSSDAIKPLPAPIFETSPSFNVDAVVFSATQPHIFYSIETANTSTQHQHHHHHHNKIMSDGVGSTSPSRVSSSSPAGGGGINSKPSTSQGRGGKPPVQYLLTLYDMLLQRTLLVHNFSDPSPSSASSSFGASSFNTAHSGAPRFEALPFHRTTHSTTTSDILILSTGVFVAIDHSAPKFPKITACSPHTSIIPALLPTVKESPAKRMFLEQFSFALMGVDLRPGAPQYTTPPSFNFVFHWLQKSESVLDARTKGQKGAANNRRGQNGLMKVPPLGGTAKDVRSAERLRHKAHVARMTHEMEMLEDSEEQARTTRKKRQQLRSLDDNEEVGNDAADEREQDDTNIHEAFVNKLLLFPYGPVSSTAKGGHQQQQHAGRQILPPVGSGGEKQQQQRGGGSSIMKSHRRTAAVLCYQQRTRIVCLHFFESELRFPHGSTVAERATLLIDRIVTKLLRHISAFLPQDDNTDTTNNNRNGDDDVDAPQDLFEFDLAPICVRELNVDTNVIGDSALPLSACKRRIIVGLPNERILQYDPTGHVFTLLGTGTDRAGSLRGQIPTSVVAVDGTTCASKEGQRFAFNDGVPHAVGPPSSSSSSSTTTSDDEHTTNSSSAAAAANAVVSSSPTKAASRRRTKRNIYAADLRIGNVVAPTYWNQRQAQLCGEPTTMNVISTKDASQSQYQSYSSAARSRPPATLLWAGKDLYCHTVDDPALALPELQMLSCSEGERRFRQSHPIAATTSTASASDWESEDGIIMATSPVDTTGVYFSRGGLLCRLDRRNRTIHVLYRIALCDGELTRREADGDVASEDLSAGMERIHFNCDGTKLLRYNAVYNTASVYDVSSFLYNRVSTVTEEVLSKSVFVSGLPWNGCSAMLQRRVEATTSAAPGQIAMMANVAYSAADVCVPKELLRGFLRCLSSMTTKSNLLLQLSNNNNNNPNQNNGNHNDGCGNNVVVLVPDPTKTGMHSQRLLRAITSPHCSYQPNVRDADGRVAASVLVAASNDYDNDVANYHVAGGGGAGGGGVVNDWWDVLLRNGASIYIPDSQSQTPLSAINNNEPSSPATLSLLLPRYGTREAIHSYRSRQLSLLSRLATTTTTTTISKPPPSSSTVVLSSHSFTDAGYYIQHSGDGGTTHLCAVQTNKPSSTFNLFEIREAEHNDDLRFIVVPHDPRGADCIGMLRGGLFKSESSQLPPTLPLIPPTADIILLSSGHVVAVQWSSTPPTVGVSRFDASRVFPSNTMMGGLKPPTGGGFLVAGPSQQEFLPTLLSPLSLLPHGDCNTTSSTTISKRYRKAMRHVLRESVKMAVRSGDDLMMNNNNDTTNNTTTNNDNGTISATTPVVGDTAIIKKVHTSFQSYKRSHASQWGIESFQRSKVHQQLRQSEVDRNAADGSGEEGIVVGLVMAPAGSEYEAEMEFLLEHHLPSSSSDDEPEPERNTITSTTTPDAVITTTTTNANRGDNDADDPTSSSSSSPLLPTGTLVTLSMNTTTTTTTPPLQANSTVLKVPTDACIKLLYSALCGSSSNDTASTQTTMEELATIISTSLNGTPSDTTVSHSFDTRTTTSVVSNTPTTTVDDSHIRASINEEALGLVDHPTTPTTTSTTNNTNVITSPPASDLEIPIACCMPTPDLFLVAVTVPIHGDEVKLYIGSRHCFGRLLTTASPSTPTATPQHHQLGGPIVSGRDTILWRHLTIVDDVDINAMNTGTNNNGCAFEDERTTPTTSINTTAIPAKPFGASRRASISAIVDGDVLRVCLGVAETFMLTVPLHVLLPPPTRVVPPSRASTALRIRGVIQHQHQHNNHNQNQPPSIEASVTTRLPPIYLPYPEGWRAPPHASTPYEVTRSAWIPTSSVVFDLINVVKLERKNSSNTPSGLLRVEVAKMWLSKLTEAGGQLLLLQRGGALVLHVPGVSDASFITSLIPASSPSLSSHNHHHHSDSHHHRHSGCGNINEDHVMALAGELSQLHLVYTPHRKYGGRPSPSIIGIDATISQPLSNILVSSLSEYLVDGVRGSSGGGINSAIKDVEGMLTVCDGVAPAAASIPDDVLSMGSGSAVLYDLPTDTLLPPSSCCPKVLSTTYCSTNWWPSSTTSSTITINHIPAVAALYDQVCAFLDGIEGGTIPPSHTDRCGRNVLHVLICLLEVIVMIQTPAAKKSSSNKPSSPVAASVIPMSVVYNLIRRVTHSRTSVFIVDPISRVAPVDNELFQSTLSIVRSLDRPQQEATGTTTTATSSGNINNTNSHVPPPHQQDDREHLSEVTPLRVLGGSSMSEVKLAAWSSAVPNGMYHLTTENTLYFIDMTTTTTTTSTHKNDNAYDGSGLTTMPTTTTTDDNEGMDSGMHGRRHRVVTLPTTDGPTKAPKYINATMKISSVTSLPDDAVLLHGGLLPDSNNSIKKSNATTNQRTTSNNINNIVSGGSANGSRSLLKDQMPCDMILFSTGAYALVYFDLISTTTTSSGWGISSVDFYETGGFAWYPDVAPTTSSALVDPKVSWASTTPNRVPSPNHVGAEIAWFIQNGQRILSGEEYERSMKSWMSTHRRKSGDIGRKIGGGTSVIGGVSDVGDVYTDNTDYFSHLPPFNSALPIGVVVTCIGDGALQAVEFYAPAGIDRFYSRHIIQLIQTFHQAQVPLVLEAGGGAAATRPRQTSQFGSQVSDAATPSAEGSDSYCNSVTNTSLSSPEETHTSSRPSSTQCVGLIDLYPQLSSPLGRMRDLLSTMRAAEARVRDLQHHVTPTTTTSSSSSTPSQSQVPSSAANTAGDDAIRARMNLQLELDRERRVSSRATQHATLSFLTLGRTVDTTPTLTTHLQTSSRIPRFAHTYISFIQPPPSTTITTTTTSPAPKGRIVVSRGVVGDSGNNNGGHTAHFFTVPGLKPMGCVRTTTPPPSHVTSGTSPFHIPAPSASYFVCGTNAAMGTCVWGSHGGLNVLQERNGTATSIFEEDAITTLRSSDLVLSAAHEVEDDEEPIRRSACCVGIHQTNGLCVVAEGRDVAFEPRGPSSKSALVVYDLHHGTASRVYARSSSTTTTTSSSSPLPQDDTGDLSITFAPRGPMLAVQNLRTGAIMIVPTDALSNQHSTGSSSNAANHKLLYNFEFVHALHGVSSSKSKTSAAPTNIIDDEEQRSGNAGSRGDSMRVVLAHLLRTSSIPVRHLYEANLCQSFLRREKGASSTPLSSPPPTFQERLSLLKEARVRHNAMHSAVIMAGRCASTLYGQDDDTTPSSSSPVTVSSVVDSHGHTALISLLTLHQQWRSMLAITEVLVAGRGEFNEGFHTVVRSRDQEVVADEARRTGAAAAGESVSEEFATVAVNTTTTTQGDTSSLLFTVPVSDEDIAALMEEMSNIPIDGLPSPLTSSHSVTSFTSNTTTASFTLTGLKRGMLRAFATKLQYYLALGIPITTPIPSGPLQGRTPSELLLLDVCVPLRSTFDMCHGVFSPLHQLEGILSQSMRPMRGVAIGLLRKVVADGYPLFMVVGPTPCIDRYEAPSSLVRPTSLLAAAATSSYNVSIALHSRLVGRVSGTMQEPLGGSISTQQHPKRRRTAAVDEDRRRPFQAILQFELEQDNGREDDTHHSHNVKEGVKQHMSKHHDAGHVNAYHLRCVVTCLHTGASVETSIHTIHLPPTAPHPTASVIDSNNTSNNTNLTTATSGDVKGRIGSVEETTTATTSTSLSSTVTVATSDGCVFRLVVSDKGDETANHHVAATMLGDMPMSPSSHGAPTFAVFVQRSGGKGPASMLESQSTVADINRRISCSSAGTVQPMSGSTPNLDPTFKPTRSNSLSPTLVPELTQHQAPPTFAGASLTYNALNMTTTPNTTNNTNNMMSMGVSDGGKKVMMAAGSGGGVTADVHAFCSSWFSCDGGDSSTKGGICSASIINNHEGDYQLSIVGMPQNGSVDDDSAFVACESVLEHSLVPPPTHAACGPMSALDAPLQLGVGGAHTPPSTTNLLHPSTSTPFTTTVPSRPTSSNVVGDGNGGEVVAWGVRLSSLSTLLLLHHNGKEVNDNNKCGGGGGGGGCVNGINIVRSTIHLSSLEGSCLIVVQYHPTTTPSPSTSTTPATTTSTVLWVSLDAIKRLSATLSTTTTFRNGGGEGSIIGGGDGVNSAIIQDNRYQDQIASLFTHVYSCTDYDATTTTTSSTLSEDGLSVVVLLPSAAMLVNMNSGAVALRVPTKVARLPPPPTDDSVPLRQDTSSTSGINTKSGDLEMSEGDASMELGSTKNILDHPTPPPPAPASVPPPNNNSMVGAADRHHLIAAAAAAAGTDAVVPSSSAPPSTASLRIVRFIDDSSGGRAAVLLEVQYRHVVSFVKENITTNPHGSEATATQPLGTLYILNNNTNTSATSSSSSPSTWSSVRCVTMDMTPLFDHALDYVLHKRQHVGLGEDESRGVQVAVSEWMSGVGRDMSLESDTNPAVASSSRPGTTTSSSPHHLARNNGGGGVDQRPPSTQWKQDERPDPHIVLVLPANPNYAPRPSSIDNYHAGGVFDDSDEDAVVDNVAPATVLPPPQEEVVGDNAATTATVDADVPAHQKHTLAAPLDDPMLASNTNMTVEGRPPTDFDGNSSSDDDDDMDDDDGAYVVVLDISLGAALAAAQAGVYQSTLRLDDDFAPPTLGSTVPALPYLRHLQFDVSDSTFGYNPSDGTLPMPRATEQRHGVDVAEAVLHAIATVPTRTLGSTNLLPIFM